MASKNRIKSTVADGASAVGHELDTATSLVTSGAKLLSVANAGVEEFAIDKDGKLISRSGSGQIFTFLSQQTENSVQAAYEFRCNPARSSSVPHTLWYNGDGTTVMMSLNPIATGSMLTFLQGGGITGNATGLYGGTSNSLRFTASGMEMRCDYFSVLTATGGEGAGGYFDIRTMLTNQGTSFGGDVGCGDAIRLLGTGGQGRTFRSEEVTLNQSGAGVFNLESVNNASDGKRIYFLALRRPTQGIFFHIDPYGAIHTHLGTQFVSKGITNADPVQAYATLQVANNTFDTGDYFSITTPASGVYSFIETTNFTVGASATDTATNIKNAINATAVLNTYVVASSVGDTVTIKSITPGLTGNRYELSESDGATNNFVLGTGPGGEFQGATNNGLAAVFDTDVAISNDPDRRLLSLRNGTRERFAIGPEGGINVRRTSTASSVNSAGEVIIGVTDTSAARTVTLDTDDCVAGRIVIIKDESGGAGTNNITIATEGSQAIDGDTSDTNIKITANYGCVRLYSDGTNWFSW